MITRDHTPSGDLSRRQFVTGIAAGSAAMGLGLTATAANQTSPSANQLTELRGNVFDLNIDYLPVNYTGRQRLATAINGCVPAPVLRWKEGERVTLRVKNNLAHDSSIHWHGIILPSEMDGVPGMSFAGIKPGETFDYAFDVNQNGSYWYHSHSGYQEQTGMYGAIIIDPKEKPPFSYDREYVLQLSDWSDEAPQKVYSTLKKLSHYYNFNERTLADTLRDIQKKGLIQSWKDRQMWNEMRMADSDIADVTAYTYTFLMNGCTPDKGWTGTFKPGEKILLRVINSAAMTFFDVRIPGLKMTVIASDGQYVEPVTVDEFRIAAAETYDVLIEPEADTAYTLFAQSIDRSGYARGTLTPKPGLIAAIPAMDHRPVLGHQDMGMGHSSMDHSSMSHGTSSHGAIDHSDMHHGDMEHSAVDHQAMDHSKMNHGGMHHQTHHSESALARAGYGSKKPIRHGESEYGPHVDMRAEMPVSGLTDPGVGLREHQQRYGRRVLRYADLQNLYETHDQREPSRELQLHLTGNMHRYMWSMNGIKFADAEPLFLKYGERLRITLVNDTMMTHPIHLHGMWSELETGNPKKLPKKHTVIVQPGSKISYLVTADALGRWAYHCHLLYHMSGMAREVRVTEEGITEEGRT